MTMTISRAAMDALRELCDRRKGVAVHMESVLAILDLCTVVEPTAASAEAQPASDGDWPEDFIYENGNYTCSCVTCGREFIGHKRRHTCRVCAKSASTPALREVTDAIDIFSLAEKCGAQFENEEPSSMNSPGTPATFLFTDRQLDEFAYALRAPLSTAQGVPDGWKLVPVEPTEAMMSTPLVQWDGGKAKCAAYTIYKSFLAAAPEAP